MTSLNGVRKRRLTTKETSIAKKLTDKSYFLNFSHARKICMHTRKTSNGSNFGWLIRQMSINQKSGRQTFRRRFVSGSLFVSPCPPERNFKSETKIEPDLRLESKRIVSRSLIVFNLF